MPLIQFESAVEGNVIRIPEQYINQIPSRVSVMLGEVEQLRNKRHTLDYRKTHKAAFEEFFEAMAEIDDEPLDDEFDAVLAKRVNITRKLDL